MKNWHGILKILYLEHLRDGKVIRRDENILNLLHSQGEFFVLSTCFNNDGTSVLPPTYYFGLDARATLSVDDTMEDILDEPSGSGYGRVGVASNGAFDIQQVSGIYRAVSPILTYSATGTGFGPVRNIFMTTEIDDSGYLMASAVLSSPLTLTAGETVNLRMSLQLQDNT